MPVAAQRCDRTASSVFALSFVYLWAALAASCASAQSGSTTVSVSTQASSADAAAQARIELNEGTRLTTQRQFDQAIAHLRAARPLGADAYAASVNLAISFLGLARYKEAADVLLQVRADGTAAATVDNLLAQAYLGDGRNGDARARFEAASNLTPKDERLYAFIADACTDHQDYPLGLYVAETGLRQLPDSARLHYERALFLARLDRLAEAKSEFDLAARIDPQSYIATLAMVQKALFNQEYAHAAQLLREAVKNGHNDYRTLSLLGTVLLSTGASPGEPAFVEAQKALEDSASESPNFSATQIALGKILSAEGNYTGARDHLEVARRLEPSNPAIYANLAHVYRKLGDLDKSRAMESQLAKLLAEKK